MQGYALAYFKINLMSPIEFIYSRILNEIALEEMLQINNLNN